MKRLKKSLTKERKQRHNYIKLRGRTEASWSFTQYPLDVTKVLTIPWEFKTNTLRMEGKKQNQLLLLLNC